MDETRNSFSYRGRQYWLDVNAMEVINYSLSYDVSVELACKALNINPMTLDNSVPEWELYVDYVKLQSQAINPEQEKRYIKSKLWNIIDGQNRTNDIIKAMEMLLSLSIPELTENKDVFKDMSFEELSELLSKVK
jgi:hypothetical protein